MLMSPVTKMASILPTTIRDGSYRCRGDPHQGAARAFEHQRAHAETAADEEEDDRDGGGEVVEDAATGVAEAQGADADGGELRGRARSEVSGVQSTGQPGRDRFGPLLARQRRRPADHVEAGGVTGTRSHYRDQQVGELGMGAGQDHPARQRAVGDLLAGRSWRAGRRGRAPRPGVVSHGRPRPPLRASCPSRRW